MIGQAAGCAALLNEVPGQEAWPGGTHRCTSQLGEAGGWVLRIGRIIAWASVLGKGYWLGSLLGPGAGSTQQVSRSR